MVQSEMVSPFRTRVLFEERRIPVGFCGQAGGRTLSTPRVGGFWGGLPCSPPPGTEVTEARNVYCEGTIGWVGHGRGPTTDLLPGMRLLRVGTPLPLLGVETTLPPGLTNRTAPIDPSRGPRTTFCWSVPRAPPPLPSP